MFSKTVSVGFILTLVALLGSTEGWVMRAVYHNDAYPGKCYVNEHLILSPGQVAKSPEGCSEIHCGNENGHSEVVGCSKVASPDNCSWDGLEDVNAPFPLCCVEKFICDSSENEVAARKLQEHLREMFKRQVEEKKHNN